MLRKTITIDEELVLALKREGIIDQFKNFSDLVSNSLQNTLESMKQEKYRQQIEKMANDPMVIEDIENIQEDFKYVDSESNAM